MMKKRGVTIVELLFVAVIFFLMITLLMPFVKMAKARGRRIGCENNLREISIGLLRYAADHAEAFPEDLGKLYPEYVRDRSVFDCPSSRSIGTPATPDYVYNTGLKLWSSPRGVIVEDQEGSHRGNGKNVLRLDGSIEWDKPAR